MGQADLPYLGEGGLTLMLVLRLERSYLLTNTNFWLILDIRVRKTTLRLGDLLEGLAELKGCYTHGYSVLRKGCRLKSIKGKGIWSEVQEKLCIASRGPFSVESYSEVKVA